MSNRSFSANIPFVKPLAIAASVMMLTAPAFASEPTPAPKKTHTVLADNHGNGRVAADPEPSPNPSEPGPEVSPGTVTPPGTNPDGTPAATTTTTVTTGQLTPQTDAPKKYGGSATWDTSVGIGTFVSGAQNSSLVVSSLSASGFYALADHLRLTAGMSLTWYQVLNFDTTLDEHTVLLSDISIGLSHSRIFRDADSGFNLGGSIRIGLPTSLASQFQNRYFSLATGLNASLPVGPVTFAYGFTFGKYFNRTAVSTVDCEDFEDESECIEGRSNNNNFGFESERRGPEVYLRGSGASSYYFTNAIDISWAIIEGLDLSLGISISNSFGVRSFPEDEFTGAHAEEGRRQSDRLTSSLSLSYQFMKNLSAALAFVTDTSQPFGAQGDEFPVIFDFERAPDNISSISLSVTGSF